MTALVVFDSQFGNTEKIALALAESLRGAKALTVKEASGKDLNGIDGLIVGSPTQGGRATAAMQYFLEQIPEGKLKGIKVAAFDTRFDERKVNLVLKLLMKTIDYAAPKMAKILIAKGGELIVPPEGFMVAGKEGPLVDGELERAKKWIRF